MAYFENFWRAKKVAYKPPKCGLFSTLKVAYFEPWISHQIAANCGLNVAYFCNLRQFCEIFWPAAANFKDYLPAKDYAEFTKREFC